MKTHDELLEMSNEMQAAMEKTYVHAVSLLERSKGSVPPLSDLNSVISQLSRVLDQVEDIIDESSGNPLPSFMLITSAATLVRSRMIVLRDRLRDLKCQLN